MENWAKKNAFPYFQDPVSLLMMHMLQASLQVMAAEKLILFFLFLQVEWQGIEINWRNYVANHKNERKSRWVAGSMLKDLLN